MRKAPAGLTVVLAAAMGLSLPALAESVQVFSGASSLTPVLRLLTRAKKSLDAELFLFSDPKVIVAVLDGANRGVRFRILLEPSIRPNRSTAEKLKHRLVELRWFKADEKAKGRNKQRLHARAACADGSRLMVGSADWTTTALNRDRETLVAVDSNSASKEWTAEFEKAWERADLEVPRRYILEDELKSLPDPKSYIEGDPRFQGKRDL